MGVTDECLAQAKIRAHVCMVAEAAFSAVPLSRRNVG